jgi:PLP dependent protein
MFPGLEGRIEAAQERIEHARERCGRTGEVRLVVVTKTFPPDAVQAVIDAGIRDVGENRVQELEEKVEALGRTSARWHFVGRLQRRKAKSVAVLADLVHSVDSLRLAERLSRDAGELLDRPLTLLVQVNTSGEEAKTGVAGPGALEEIAAIAELQGLRVDGLMTMAPFTHDEAVLRSTFRGAADLFDRARAEVDRFHGAHLSMGMSNDFEIAIEEGSTMVRLGTVILGERDR